MSVRSRPPFSISILLSFSFSFSWRFHTFYLGEYVRFRCTALSPRNFLSAPFLNCARDRPLCGQLAENSQENRRFSLRNAFRGAFTRKRNTTASYECSWLFNISAYLSTNGSASGKAGLAYRETQLSSCYVPAERMYCNFVSTNQNRRNRQ